MTRDRSLLLLVVALVLTSVAAAQAQPPEGGRRGFGRGSRSSLLGLLRVDEVRTELNLNDEQATKVGKLTEDLGAEMREQFTALRDIEDRDERRAKMTDLTDEFDRKAREQLRDVLEREQMMRLYQIRMQVRPAVDSLANQWVARRLELTEEQKTKLAQMTKDMQAKQSELYGQMRDASQDQRGEFYQKLRELRGSADDEALALLTAEQKESLEEMKGEKIELPTRRGPR